MLLWSTEVRMAKRCAAIAVGFEFMATWWNGLMCWRVLVQEGMGAGLLGS